MHSTWNQGCLFFFSSCLLGLFWFFPNQHLCQLCHLQSKDTDKCKNQWVHGQSLNKTWSGYHNRLRLCINSWVYCSLSIVLLWYIYIVNLLMLLWMCVWLQMLSTPCLIPCACIFYLTCGNKGILIDWLIKVPNLTHFHENGQDSMLCCHLIFEQKRLKSKSHSWGHG